MDTKLRLKLRDIRNSRRITLQSLADMTKLTTSFISQAERGIVSPSIDSLRKLAQALGVNIREIFEEDIKGFTFIRKNKALKVIDRETKSSYETLVSDLLGIKMQPLIFRLQKGGKVKRELLLEEGDTFVIVMEGSMELHCDKEKFVLNKGDSFYCRGQQRLQKITNAGNKETVLLWVQSK